MPRTSSKRSASSSASSKRRRTSKTFQSRGNMLPLQILKQVAKPVTIAHRCVGAVTFNGATGWNGAGSNSLTMAFTRDSAYYSVGGAAYIGWGQPYDNGPSMANVYDMYRVKKIILDIYPNINSNGVNNAAVYSPVMVYCTPDYTDANALTSANAALAFNDCKVFQMIADSTEAGKTKFQLVIDRPTCDVNVDSINTGITTNSMAARSPWLYTNNTTAEFGYAKFWAESAYPTAGVIMGWTVVVTSVYEYKLVR